VPQAIAVAAAVLGLVGAWTGGVVFHLGRKDRWNSSGLWGASAEAFGAVLAGLAVFVALQHHAGNLIPLEAVWSCALFAGVAAFLSVLYLVLLFAVTPSTRLSRRKIFTWKGRARWSELTVDEFLPGASILSSAILLVVSVGL
jgi:hypothetical protein